MLSSCSSFIVSSSALALSSGDGEEEFPSEPGLERVDSAGSKKAAGIAIRALATSD